MKKSNLKKLLLQLSEIPSDVIQNMEPGYRMLAEKIRGENKQSK